MCRCMPRPFFFLTTMLFVIAKNRKQFGIPSREVWLNTSRHIPTTECYDILEKDGISILVGSRWAIPTNVTLYERSQTQKRPIVHYAVFPPNPVTEALTKAWYNVMVFGAGAFRR